MATNRFREAIKGKGKEILSAGKPDLEGEIEEKEIQITDSISFIADMSEEEDTYQDSALLVKPAPAPANGELTFETVSEFLTGKVNPNVEELRINSIKDIVNALIDYNSNAEPLLLCDYKENMPYWIAAINMAVPDKVAENLNFNIQKRDSLSENCIITFTDKNNISEQRISARDINSYTKFNFINGTCNTITANSKFAKMVQVGFALEKKVFNSFKSFIAQFDYKKLDSNIDNCFELFYVVNRGIEKVDYSNIVHAMNFANTYADIDTRKQLLLNMEHLLFEINSNVDEQLAEIVIKFILKIAADSNEKIYFIKAYRFFYQCTQTLLSFEEEDAIIKAINFYNRVKTLSNIYGTSFMDYALSDENLRQMLNNIEGNEPKYGKFYLATILQLLMENRNSWRDNIPYEKFISSSLQALKNYKNDIAEVIEGVSDNAEYFSNLTIIYFDITKSEENDSTNEAVQFLIEKIDEYDDKTSTDIRNHMISSFKGYILLFEEFKTRLLLSSNKNDFFWSYSKSVFERINGFKEKYFTDALEHYLNVISGSRIYASECYRILLSAINKDIEINSTLLERVIAEYEKELTLGHPDDSTLRLLESIVSIKEQYNISTNPDVIRLINFGVNLEKASKRDDIRDLLQNTDLNFNGILINKYCEFIDWCLNVLLNNDEAKITDTINFYKKVRTLSEEGNNKYTEELLSVDKVERLRSIMDKVKPKRIQFYMLITLEYMIKGGRTWGENSPYEDFLSCCMDSLIEYRLELEGVINSVSENQDYYINLLVMYYSKLMASQVANDNDAVKMYLRNINEKGVDWEKVSIESIIGIPNGSNLIYEVYKIKISESENKTFFFWQYFKDVFESISSFKDRFFSDAAEYYLNLINGEDKYNEECIKVLNRTLNGKVTLKVNALTRVIKVYENILAIKYPGTDWENVIKKVLTLKKENKIITTPDILGIVEFGWKLENENSEEGTFSLVKNTNLSLNGIDKAKYEEYLKWCFPIICNKVNFLEASDELKRLAYREEYDEIYSKVYNEQLFKQMGSISLKESSEKIKSIFSGIEDNIEGFGNMILLYFNQSNVVEGEDDCIRLLIETIDKKDIEQRLKMRANIASLENGNALLFEEFKIRLSEARDQVKFFWRYCEIAFDEIEEYRKEYYLPAIDYYIDSIKSSSAYTEECFTILDLFNKRGMQLPQELLIKLIQGCEKALIIGESDDAQKKLLADIVEIKDAFNVITSPDIIGLLDFGTKLQKAEDADTVRKLVSSSILYLTDIDVLRYEEYLEWCLPKCLYSVNSWQVHSEIKKLMYSEPYRVIFFTKYVEILSDILERDKYDGHKIFSQFLIYFFNAKDQFSDEIVVQVRSNVSSILSRQSESKLRDIDNNIKAETSSMRYRESLLREWEAIFKKAQNNQRNADKSFSKGFRMFRK